MNQAVASLHQQTMQMNQLAAGLNQTVTCLHQKWPV